MLLHQQEGKPQEGLVQGKAWDETKKKRLMKSSTQASVHSAAGSPCPHHRTQWPTMPWRWEVALVGV